MISTTEVSSSLRFLPGGLIRKRQLASMRSTLACDLISKTELARNLRTIDSTWLAWSDSVSVTQLKCSKQLAFVSRLEEYAPALQNGNHQGAEIVSSV